jgi:hypothetical protein
VTGDSDGAAAADRFNSDGDVKGDVAPEFSASSRRHKRQGRTYVVLPSCKPSGAR